MSEREIIRTFDFERDFERVITLWRTAGEGIQLRRSDDPEEILKKLERDPELFIVCERNGAIVGAVLGGYDGRRGLMYHLAVAEPYREKGIASRLVDKLEQRLLKLGCIRYYLLVTPTNSQAIRFYENRGWEKMDLLVFAKDLE